jgi:ABC-2 type transport system ATP-binding protein
MLSEVEQTVDDVVIIANGRLIQQGSVADLHGEKRSIVRTTSAPALVSALNAAGVEAHATDATMLEAIGDDMSRVGDIALSAGLPIHELRAYQTDLEALFFELTETPENRNRNRAGSTDGSSTSGQDTPATIPAAPYEGARP